MVNPNLKTTKKLLYRRPARIVDIRLSREKPSIKVAHRSRCDLQITSKSWGAKYPSTDKHMDLQKCAWPQFKASHTLTSAEACY